MKIAIIGATGRTGQPLVRRLLDDGHSLTVLVRDPAKLGAVAEQVKVVTGTSTDVVALGELLADAGADTEIGAVVSALGPSAKESDLHTRTARALVDVMPRHGVWRFVGISGAGVDVPADVKGLRDRAISTLIQKVGGKLANDKIDEYGVFAASDLDWTLVRPPRLLNGDATGKYQHDAHRPGRSTIRRADLASFVADVAEQNLYIHQAPFVWNAPN